jgi:hypothetical protein
MKVVITIEDKGVQTVSYNMETVLPESELEQNMITPASVIALAVKAMFNNGMLAEAGSHALAEAAKGVSPEESISKKYDQSNPNS